MKKSQLQNIIKKIIKESQNPSDSFYPSPDTRGWKNSDVERIIRNFKDEHYLPAMDDIDRNVLVDVLERYLDPKY